MGNRQTRITEGAGSTWMFSVMYIHIRTYIQTYIHTYMHCTEVVGKKAKKMGMGDGSMWIQMDTMKASSKLTKRVAGELNHFLIRTLHMYTRESTRQTVSTAEVCHMLIHVYEACHMFMHVYEACDMAMHVYVMAYIHTYIHVLISDNVMHKTHVQESSRSSSMDRTYKLDASVTKFKSWPSGLSIFMHAYVYEDPVRV